MKDTLFDDLVFHTGELLDHDVDETGNEARQKADQTADDPATDLQTAETLQMREEERLEKWEQIRGIANICTDLNVGGTYGC